jgi:ElaB/YqjD/DUF883 family membrane-anchored ribosome-binding protein
MEPDMAHETTMPKTTLNNADYDLVVAQMAALRDEVTKLTQNLTATLTGTGEAMAKRAGDSVGGAMDYLGRKGHAVEQRVETRVGAHPYMAIGIAAGVGLLLGALSRR